MLPASAEYASGFSPAGLITSPEQASARLWDERLARLRSLALLEGNWDDEGAEPPSDVILNSAEYLIKFLRSSAPNFPPSHIGSSAAGSVLVAWHLPEGRYVEAELSSPDIVEWMEDKGQQRFEHWTWSWTAQDRAAAARNLIRSRVAEECASSYEWLVCPPQSSVWISALRPPLIAGVVPSLQISSLAGRLLATPLLCDISTTTPNNLSVESQEVIWPEEDFAVEAAAA